MGSEREGNFYRIASVPQHLIGIAKGDLVKAEEDYGHLFFSSVADYGPNKTIQLTILDWAYAQRELIGVARQLGCEVLRRINYRVTISVPWRTMKQEDFRYIFRHLDDGMENGYWKYRSAFGDIE